MNPSQRLVLQQGWGALEDAGYAPDSVNGSRCGVFIGCEPSYYLHDSFTGASEAIVAARLSYFLNLHGPALVVNTGCSSSAVAIHLACESLRSGACDMALAGGVFAAMNDHFFVAISSTGILSATGKCRPFDDKADGTLLSEGIGIVGLKRLADAELDGDHIYGIIKGSGTNQDGKSNGITAPNGLAQEQLIADVYARYRIPAGRISYLEAHGTATRLGDPVEANALTHAFGQLTRDRLTCALGTIKSNIGHASAAAGVAGLMKVLLQLRYRQLPPQANFETLNRMIHLEESPFYINTTLAPWTSRDGGPLLAALNSFGHSGTNAHLVVEEYVGPGRSEGPFDAGASDAAPLCVVPLSAQREDRLIALAGALLGRLENGGLDAGYTLRDLAFTLQVGRKPLAHRVAFLATDAADLRGKLRAFLAGETGDDWFRGTDSRGGRSEVTLGQLAQWIGVGHVAPVARSWASGTLVDWTALWGDDVPRRMSLPTYPFAKERYWIPMRLQYGPFGTRAAVERSEAPAGEPRASGGRQRLLQKAWIPAPLGRDACPTGGNVAILATPATRALARTLTRRMAGAVLLMPDECATVDPASLDGLIDLTALDPAFEDRDLFTWLTWLQRMVAVGTRDDRPGLRLLQVTHRLESLQNDVVRLGGARRVALYRLLGAEHRNVCSWHMDTDGDAASEADAVCEQIVSEWQYGGERCEVCYRGGTRYRPRLVDVDVTEQANGAHDGPSPLRDAVRTDQVLLVTGGTRGIGMRCARHMVERYGITKLVLLGRERFPDARDWRAILARPIDVSASPDQKRLRRKLEDVTALLDAGVQVKVLSNDLEDATALRRLLHDALGDLGPIFGVIHSAGVADLDTLAFLRKTPATMAAVFQPKVDGLHVLDAAVADQPVRFFLLCSSVAALVPRFGVGNADYAMANAYLDYYAAAQHALGRPHYVSIQWPNWSESGMGKLATRVYRDAGFTSLDDAQALELLDRILDAPPVPVVMPVVTDEASWRPERLLDEVVSDPTSREEPPPAPVPALPPNDGTLVEACVVWLTTELSNGLNIAATELDADVPFEEFGVDSILIAQILRDLNALTESDLDPSLLFEHTSIRALATYLVTHHAPMLRAALRARTTPEAMPLPPQAGNGNAPHGARTVSPAGAAAEEPAAGRFAIVGMSCRFPGASDLQAYWQLVARGERAIRPVPRERWGYDAAYHAGFVDRPDEFDAAAFGIVESDAAAMDPQARMVLQQSLGAIRDAGYERETLKPSTVGVYIGGRSSSRLDQAALRAAKNPIMCAGGNYLAANVSHVFDFRGPSMVVDTACSSALVAMNLACQALRLGEVDVALVGGVSLQADDSTHRLLELRGLASRDREFHVFDERASGIVVGEGCGVVLIRRLADAVRDGDRIYGVIESLAVNNDGRSAGHAAPNMKALKAVMERGLALAGLPPESVEHIEVNGSGSEITDLLELKAMHQVYGTGGKRRCSLGSVKPNIGHPMAAEGIAAFIKVMLMLHERRKAPFLSGQRPLRHFDLQQCDFEFVRESCEWDGADGRRIAALNCFADGGTNCHLVLSGWDANPARPARRPPDGPPDGATGEGIGEATERLDWF